MILPPAGISYTRYRARGPRYSSRTKAKSTVDLGASSSSLHSDTVTSEIRNNQQQQHRSLHRDGEREELLEHQQEEQEEEQRLVRAHSLGSAKFLFDDRALSHRVHPGPPSARQRTSNGSNPVKVEGKNFRGDSARGGTTHSNVTRWGSERAGLKNPVTLYKLAMDETPQQQHEPIDMRGSPETAGSVLVAKNNRIKDTITPRTSRGAPGTREVLRRSTWLGPEVSPLQNDQDAARLNSPSRYGIKFAAAAWPSPKQRGSVRRRISRHRGDRQGGSNEGNRVRGARQQRAQYSFQPPATDTTFGIGLGPADQVLGVKVRCVHVSHPRLLSHSPLRTLFSLTPLRDTPPPKPHEG